jgi:enoyl-CoA hydratase/carnithine racemase
VNLGWNGCRPRDTDMHLQIGLPEVMLGVLPGAGGVVRTVRMLGIQNALMQVLLPGTGFTPTKARDAGLVNNLWHRSTTSSLP